MINQNLLLAGDDAYNLSKSLRFRSSASAYLSRTPASAGNRKTWTWSAWVKRGTQTEQMMFGCGVSGSDDATYTYISFGGTNADQLYVNGYTQTWRKTTQVFRDFSAWYHIVVALDTTQATASNRIKMYVNGAEITSFATANNPSQNDDLSINRGVAHSISSRNPYGADSYVDGYLTEVNFIDGQALTPSSFGETDVLTGVWKPKKYAGTYGTNGFYLPFTDVATTSGSNAGLGKDFSGNGNYWTTNNISVTAGTTYDSMTDVPTLTSASASNYCVLNPLFTSFTSITSTATGTANLVTNGNLTATSSGTTTGIGSIGTIGTASGKYYFECIATAVATGNNAVGLTRLVSDETYWYRSNGSITGDSTTGTPATWTVGDLIGVAADLDTGTITFYKNNISQGTSTITGSKIGSTFFPVIWYRDATNTPSSSINFGQRPFIYTPPTGFVALNTFNLPEPSIKQGNKYFDATLYTGTGSAQSIVNSGGFQPDFVWAKSRSNALYHNLMDAVRGTNKDLYSNSTGAEETNAQIFTALNSNGFSVGTDASANTNGATYVGWQWKGNGTGSSNTAGSITSTVSANPTAGFSVVTYTGSGSNGTVGHGLGVAPKMIFVKDRTQGGTYRDWAVYNADIGAGNSMYLNSTSGSFSKPSYWNSTTATSSVFSLGSDITVNQSGDAYVAYCFSEVAGYSKFGSYTGNGSTDGVFLHLGFRPKFVMIKNSGASGYNWIIFDTARDTYNLTTHKLEPNNSNAEGTTYDLLDILSNGFKLRTADAGSNANGSTYIYMAFAENPQKYSLGR